MSQFVKLGSEIQSSVLVLQKELRRFAGEIADELHTAEYIQPVSANTIGIVHSSLTKSGPEPTSNISAHDTAVALRNS
jgi:hypothetical protein